MAAKEDGVVDGGVRGGEAPDAAAQATSAEAARGWWKQGPRSKPFDPHREKRLCVAESSHSISSAEIFAEFCDASAEERAAYPHALASFHGWMMAGKVSKSSANYVASMKRLLEYHGKSFAELASDGYFAKVQTSCENLKGNSGLSAALKKFRYFLEERGRCTGPWEIRALPGENHFRVRDGVGASRGVPPPGSVALTAMFRKQTGGDVGQDVPPTGGAAAPRQENESAVSPSRDAIAAKALPEETPEKVERAAGLLSGSKRALVPSPAKTAWKKQRVIPKRAASFLGASAKESTQAKTAVAPARELPRDADGELRAIMPAALAGAFAAGARVDVAKGETATKPRGRANGKAKGKAQGKARGRPNVNEKGTINGNMNSSGTKRGTPKADVDGKVDSIKQELAPADTSMQAADGLGALSKSSAANTKRRKTCTSASPTGVSGSDVAAAVAEPTPAGDASSGAGALAGAVALKEERQETVSKRELGREHQLGDLLRAVRSCVRKQDFDRAEQRFHVLKAFCKEQGIPVPATLQPLPEKKASDESNENSGTAAAATADLPDEVPSDPLEVARDVLRRCFALRRPQAEAPAEDDAEICPEPAQQRGGRGRGSSRNPSAQDAAANGSAIAAEHQDYAAAFAGLPQAENQDYIRLRDVGTAFRGHLVAECSRSDAEADEFVRVFYELFQLDDKSLDTMASEKYRTLVSRSDKRQGEVVTAFAAFWPVAKNASLLSAPARLPTSEERRLASENGVPPGWRVQVFHRVAREDLVVLTSPDGAQDFMSKQGLKAMLEVDEGFAEQRRKLEAEGLQAEEARRQASAQLDRRRRFAEEHAKYLDQTAEERRAAHARLHDAIGRILAGRASGVALHGLPADCRGTYLLMERQYGGKPAYERLAEEQQRTFLFASGNRWLVAGAIEASAQAFAYVEDSASTPHEVDRDGSSWMVPTDASGGEGFQELAGAGWCAALTDNELAERAVRILQRLQQSCRICKSLPQGEKEAAQDDVEEIEAGGDKSSSAWASYDDVPNATEEERLVYPAILKLFHEEGYPYLPGVRKLMALYGKSPSSMATNDFHRLVRADPVNAICNGFDSSAILYFKLFWQKHGHKTFEPLTKKSQAALMQMPEKDRKAYIKDWQRFEVDPNSAYEIQEQAGALQDLLVDIPLTRLIADVTRENWREDLRNFLSPTAFLQEDVDASGLHVRRCGADLLPEPTEQEWSTWPSALRGFDEWYHGPGKALSRSGPARHVEPLRRLATLHGKSPAVVASQRYGALVGSELGRDSAEAAAAAAFAEFWTERGEAPLPDPRRGLLFGTRLPARWCVPSLATVRELGKARRRLQLPADWDLDLEPHFRASDPSTGREFADEESLRSELKASLEARQAEQRRKDAIAREWNLPPRFEVEFKDDSTPFIIGPDGEEYASPEEVPRPRWMYDGPDEGCPSRKGSRGSSEVSGRGVGSGGSGGESNVQKLNRLMAAAADRADFAEARRLKAAILACKSAASVPKSSTSAVRGCSVGGAAASGGGSVAVADSADTSAARSEGADTSGGGGSSTGVESRCRAGKMPIVRRTADQAEEEKPKSRKYTKNGGLKAQQERQIETGELMLQQYNWRLVGVRGPEGDLLPVDQASDDPSDVVCVLAQISDDIIPETQARIREQWGVDESWKIQVRLRSSGNQITVWSPDGRAYLNQSQFLADRRRRATRQLRELRARSLRELLQMVRGDATSSAFGPFEVADAGRELAALRGLYLPLGQDAAGSFMRVHFSRSCERSANCASGGAAPAVVVVRRRSTDGRWEFVERRGEEPAVAETVVAEAVGDAAGPSGQLLAPGTDAALGGQPIRNLQRNGLVSQVVTNLGEAQGSDCKLCSRKLTGNSSSSSSSKTAERNEKYEGVLRALSLRRRDAPRTLGNMTSHMLRKLLELRPEFGARLQRFFGGSDAPIERRRPFRLGTLCSGTDSPAIALKHFSSAVAALLGGGDFPVHHVFSCENDPVKRDFLTRNFDMDYLFSECTQMGRSRAWDAKTQTVQDVPGDLDLLIAGFSCKDLSFMNSYRKTLEEMGQSGSTLRGCLDYVERYRPRVVILENVYAIERADQHGLKQVNIVMEGLRARGYAAGYALCNSCDYYVPQVRHRIWMWGYRMTAESPTICGASEDATRDEAFRASTEVNPKVQALLRVLEEPSALHFDDCLLDEGDARVQEFNRSMCGRAKADADMSRRNVKLTWQQKYTMHRAKLDYNQERPYTSERGARWKLMLNKRTLELLDLKCLDVLNEQGLDPREVPMLWDLLQSVERVPGTRVRRDRQNYAMCVLPPSQLWHTVRHRFLLGQERLALQGIFEEDLRDVASFSQVLLSDLAGNAFTTTVCLANLVCAAVYADEVAQ